MTVELSKEELEMIEGWYHASAGESAHDRDEALFALLEKFGFEASHRDLWASDPKDFIESYRATAEAHRKAIISYRKRHPDLGVVKEAEEEQPL